MLDSIQQNKTLGNLKAIVDNLVLQKVNEKVSETDYSDSLNKVKERHLEVNNLDGSNNEEQISNLN